MPAIKLMDALMRIEENTAGDKVSIGDVVESLNSRGFGTLLLFPALLVALPTGAIPFMPVVCGIFIMLVCCQIVAGKRHPWLPKLLKNMGMKRESYDRAVKSSTPVIHVLDAWSSPRLKFLVLPMAQRFTALICIILSIVMIAVAVLPIASHVFGLAILCFALGLSARDGIMTLLGFAISVAAFVILPWIITYSQALMGPHVLAPLPTGF